ncbi:MAG: Nif3-like dinuclear metal center hexameric protein [Eubacteriales bacterium]|nr:Nif3-like dinuclear metal center hexameric protein [Eubacteriales bacterium]
MRCEEIISRLEEEYPLGCAEEWDNPGLLVGRRNKEVRRIFVALDATEDTIRQALEYHADLMITHHPLIFRSIKQINEDTFIGRRILTLIENEISLYAMHTNFDVLGMAALNEKQLRLENCRVLEVTMDTDGIEEGLGRIGDLPEPMTLAGCAAYVRKRLDVPEVRCYGLDDEQESLKNPDDVPLVSRVAVCGGSGKSVVSSAIEEGAEVLVTGDIDYHTAIDALAQGLYIIDAGHYGTEYVFIEYMKKKLKKLFPECECKGARIVQPFTSV